MEIPPFLRPVSATSPLSDAPAPQQESLKPGSVIEVTVKARLGENRFLLQRSADGKTLSAFSRIDLPLNQKLHLQLAHPGNPPEFRLLPLPARTEEAILPKVLREFLPKQADIGELIKFWEGLSRNPDTNPPDSIRFAMDSLIAALPEKTQLFTADGLKKALLESGLFHEAQLAAQLTSGTPFPGNDLKARLLHLLSVVRAAMPRTAEETSAAKFPENSPAQPSPLQTGNDHALPEMTILDRLALKAEGALAKITVDQLASQPQDGGPAALQLTIPFTDGNYQDSARLFITPDTSEAFSEDSPSSWTATIELQPPGIGKFNARLVWNGSRIEATMWSDREETGALMRGYCELLRARLDQAGLETGNITVLNQPPVSTPKKTDALPLLDLHA